MTIGQITLAGGFCDGARSAETKSPSPESATSAIWTLHCPSPGYVRTTVSQRTTAAIFASAGRGLRP